MARKPQPAADTNAWMNTYADMVTLLLCFFVLLYSMSAIDVEKWQALADALSDRPPAAPQQSDTPGGVAGQMDSESESQSESELEAEMMEENMPQSFDDLYDYLVAYMQEQGMQDSVSITKGDGAIYIRFSNNIFFFPDSAVIKQESMPVLDFLGDCLYSVEDQIYLININGHTASVDYEFYPVSSWTLSGERATNIAIFFEDQKSINPKKLRPIGYADNYPVAPNDTDENRRLNRRVDMVIVSNDAVSSGVLGELAGLFDPSVFPREGGFGDIMVPGSNGGSLVRPGGPDSGPGSNSSFEAMPQPDHLGPPM